MKGEKFNVARPVIDAHSIVYRIGERDKTSNDRRIRARLERKIAKNPEVDLYIRLAYFEAEQQNWDLAQEAIDSALKMEPNHADAMLLLAQILESKGETQKAKKAYQSVIEQHSTFSKAYREYGRFFMRQESQHDQAQTYLLRALELRPKDALAHLLLAEIFIQRDRRSQGLLHLEIAKRFQDEEPLFHCRSVPLFLQLNQFEEALKQLKKALKYDPKNKQIRMQLRQLEKKIKKKDQKEKPQFWKRWKA